MNTNGMSGHTHKLKQILYLPKYYFGILAIQEPKPQTTHNKTI